MAKRQRKLFFSSEYSVKLCVDKEDGTRIVIVDKEELYFKLKFDKMKLSNPEEFFRRYPDGWVKGRVTYAAAETSKIQAEAELEVIKIQADAAEYAGQKDAAVNKAIADSITNGLLEYYYIQNWNGELPDTYVGSEDVSTIITGKTGN